MVYSPARFHRQGHGGHQRQGPFHKVSRDTPQPFRTDPRNQVGRNVPDAGGQRGRHQIQKPRSAPYAHDRRRNQDRRGPRRRLPGRPHSREPHQPIRIRGLEAQAGGRPDGVARLISNRTLKIKYQ